MKKRKSEMLQKRYFNEKSEFVYINNVKEGKGELSFMCKNRLK